MSEKNYPIFRNLLGHAIGGRTQAQFANEAGISAEHLNRMLNASKISRPTKKTLSLIAAVAKNGVSYYDLEAALELDSDLAQEEEDAEKGPDPSFREAAVETIKTMSDILGDLRGDLYPCIIDSLDDFVSDVINNIKKYYPHAPEISFEVDVARPYIGETHQDVPLQSTVWLSMADVNTSASTEMIIYFSKAAGRIVLHDMSVSVADIYDIHGLPFRPQDDQGDEEDKDNVVVGPPLGNGEDASGMLPTMSGLRRTHVSRRTNTPTRASRWSSGSSTPCSPRILFAPSGFMVQAFSWTRSLGLRRLRI